MKITKLKIIFFKLKKNFFKQFFFSKKVILLTFTNVNIDCTSDNNLKLDTGFETYTFCGNQTSNTFKFYTTRSNYIAIIKYGVVSFTCSVEFILPTLFVPSNNLN